MIALLDRPLWRVVERKIIVARRSWYVFLAGGLEPFLFLFSVGVGVGALIDGVTGPGGIEVTYRQFVAPAMLAGAAMNTAVLDSTITFYVAFRYMGTYDPMLATPMTTRDVVRGELAWTLGRVALYGSAFVLTMAAMGLLESWWSILLVPAAVLIGFGFGGVAMAATTWMRSWLDFDLVFVATVPLFLFSATFFPLDQYPDALQPLVQLSPLYHGADLARRLTFGEVGWAQLISVAYLIGLGAVGLRIAQRRVAGLLQP